MDMISHQAVCVYLTAELMLEVDKVFPVIIVIVVRDKYCLSIMTSLNNVVGSIR